MAHAVLHGATIVAACGRRECALVVNALMVVLIDATHGRAPIAAGELVLRTIGTLLRETEHVDIGLVLDSVSVASLEGGKLIRRVVTVVVEHMESDARCEEVLSCVHACLHATSPEKQCIGVLIASSMWKSCSGEHKHVFEMTVTWIGQRIGDLPLRAVVAVLQGVGAAVEHLPQEALLRINQDVVLPIAARALWLQHDPTVDLYRDSAVAVDPTESPKISLLGVAFGTGRAMTSDFWESLSSGEQSLWRPSDVYALLFSLLSLRCKASAAGSALFVLSPYLTRGLCEASAGSLDDNIPPVFLRLYEVAVLRAVVAVASASSGVSPSSWMQCMYSLLLREEELSKLSWVTENKSRREVSRVLSAIPQLHTSALWQALAAADTHSLLLISEAVLARFKLAERRQQELVPAVEDGIVRDMWRNLTGICQHADVKRHLPALRMGMTAFLMVIRTMRDYGTNIALVLHPEDDAKRTLRSEVVAMMALNDVPLAALAITLSHELMEGECAHKIGRQALLAFCRSLPSSARCTRHFAPPAWHVTPVGACPGRPRARSLAYPPWVLLAAAVAGLPPSLGASVLLQVISGVDGATEETPSPGQDIPISEESVAQALEAVYYVVLNCVSSSAECQLGDAGDPSLGDYLKIFCRAREAHERTPVWLDQNSCTNALASVSLRLVALLRKIHKAVEAPNANSLHETASSVVASIKTFSDAPSALRLRGLPRLRREIAMLEMELLDHGGQVESSVGPPDPRRIRTPVVQDNEIVFSFDQSSPLSGTPPASPSTRHSPREKSISPAVSARARWVPALSIWEELSSDSEEDGAPAHESVREIGAHVDDNHGDEREGSASYDEESHDSLDWWDFEAARAMAADTSASAYAAQFSAKKCQVKRRRSSSASLSSHDGGGPCVISWKKERVRGRLIVPSPRQPEKKRRRVVVPSEASNVA